MGYYINPKDETKEEFLRKNAIETTKDDFKRFTFENDLSLPVCLVDNGFFTAAGVAYSESERDAFVMESDNRPKRFFVCSVERLKKVVWNLEEVLKPNVT